MEKELQQYRKTLKTQNICYAIGGVALAALIALSIAEVVKPVAEGERWASGWNGFLCGVSTAVLGCMLVGFIMNCRAFRNEARLRKLYIKEHDERAEAINRYAGHRSYWFETLGLLLGTIISGYFSVTVAIVCLCCLFYICLVRLALKLYYSKKLS